MVPREQVWCQSLEVLENSHAEGVTKNLLGLLVVDISDVLGADEQLEWVLGVCVPDAALDLLLNLLLALFAVTGKAQQLILVCPEYALVQLDVHVKQNMVEVDNDVLLPVADNDEETALLLLHVVADERRNARINRLFHHLVSTPPPPPGEVDWKKCA